MLYRIELDATVSAGIKRVALEQAELARSHLIHPPNDDIHEGIHEARKCFKRLRGVLRLARPVLGKKIYRQENARYRDAAHSLSAVRDAQAMVECFDMLEKSFGRRVNFDRMRSLRTKLKDHRDNLASDQSAVDERVENIIEELRNAVSIIHHWPLKGSSCEDYACGLQRVYRRASKAWKRVRSRHDPEIMHEWRKRAKYLCYHYRLIKDIDKNWAKKRKKGFKHLSDLLGDHHDLDVLRKKLDAMEDSGLNVVAECEFRTLLRLKQDFIYQATLQCGSPLLQKKAKKLRKQVYQRLLEAHSNIC
ncbi:MAG: CHAD domain-containing protein [Nitrosomonas sp.]|nr:CHAD domain-containing protein [Nitrosomonas sp.]